MKQVLMGHFARAPRGEQTRVAEALGVRATAVNKWAKGYNVPDAKLWGKLEDVLGMEKGTLTGPTQLDAGTLAAVWSALDRIEARLDAVEQTLAAGSPAPRDPSDRANA